MKFFTLVVVCLAIVPGRIDATEISEEQAVLETLDSWNRGWLEGDASLAVQDYADEVDWTNAFGDRFEGKQALEDGLKFIFSLDFVMAGSSGKSQFRDVTLLSESVALVRSQLIRKGQQTRSGEVMPDRVINHLRVLEKRDGQWVIRSHLISQAQPKR